MDDFSKQKIIFQEMVQEPSFVLDATGRYVCNDTARIITSESVSLTALLAILNSKTFFFAMKRYYAGGGLGERGVRMKHTFMSSFPMPRKDALDAVDEVMKRCCNMPSTSDCSEIETILFEAYSFNAEERKCIQSGAY